MDEDELINRYIEPNPHKSGLAEARLVGHGISVWAIVGAWETADGDVCHVAHEYVVPVEAVRAALAYYRRHKWLITARLELNKAAFEA